MISLSNLRHHEEKEGAGTPSGSDEECGEILENGVTDESPRAWESDLPISVAHVGDEQRESTGNCGFGLGKESWCLRVSDSTAPFNGKRLSISLSSAVASLLVASLLATFVVTMVYVIQSRYVYRFRHKLEVLDKHVLRANYYAFKNSSYIAVEALSNGTVTRNNTGNDASREPAFDRSRRILDEFMEQYKVSRKHCRLLRRIHHEYEEYRDRRVARVCYHLLILCDTHARLNVHLLL